MPQINALLEQPCLAPCRKVAVMVHNSGLVSFEGVIIVLQKAFGLCQEDSMALAQKAHTDGKAMVIKYASYDIAQSKAMHAQAIALNEGWQYLRFSVEFL